MSTPADRVRQAWAAADRPAENLARLGVDPTRVRRILDGVRPPSSTDLAYIAVAAQVSVQWLIHGTGPRYVGPVCGCPPDHPQTGHHGTCPLAQAGPDVKEDHR